MSIFNFYKNNSPKKGFTLIEMMVAVSIFVIVAFVIISTLLTLSYAYRKAQRMRLLMDNFNFSLQSMSLNIREGINYNSSCDDNSCIQFKPIDAWIKNENKFICYNFYRDTENRGRIKKCVNSSCPCDDNEGLDIVSPEINVQKLSFDISANGRKKVKIIISGEAGLTARELTSFFIQNTVAQRNPDS